MFRASLEGIDLEQYYTDPLEEKRREIERRAAEKRLGAMEVERQEMAEFGLSFTVIE